MVVTFNEDYLENLYTNGKTGKKKDLVSASNSQRLSKGNSNDQYRIEFTLEELDEEPVVTICNIMELSNHYK